MTKEELLEEAKRRYPIGTEFICAYGNPKDSDKCIVKHLSKMSVQDADKIRVHYQNNWIVIDGKWAEIVSKPEASGYPTDVKYQKGDKVKVLSEAKDYERGWKYCWINLMSSNIGKVLTVNYDDGLNGVLMEEGCKYPHFVLEKVKDVKPQFEKGKWYRAISSNGWKKFEKLVGIQWWYTEEIYAFQKLPSHRIHRDLVQLPFEFQPVVDLSEIQQYLPDGHVDKLPVEPVKTDVMKELTELPEKWCLKFTKENCETLKNNKWHECPYADNYIDNFRYVCGNNLQFHCHSADIYGVELSFDQFKKWVLKESDTLKVVNPLEGRYIKCLNDVGKIHYPCHKGDYLKFVTSDGILEYWGAYNLNLSTDGTDNPRYWGGEVHKSPSFELMPVGFVPPVVSDVPEYVECLADYYDQFTKGKVYKTYQNTFGRVEKDDEGEHNSWETKNFKPSTKEAYDKQNVPLKTVKQDGVKEIVPEKGKWYEVMSTPQLSYIVKYNGNKYWDCEYISQGSYGGVGMFTGITIVRELKSDDPQIIEPLLKYARMKYPVGCQIKSAKSGNKFEVSHKNTFITDGHLYYNGKWAEIVSLPSENTATIESTPQEYNVHHLTPCSTMYIPIKENTSELIDINFDIPIVIGE